MQFFVTMCYDSSCTDNVECSGMLETGHNIMTVDNGASFLKLHFGDESRQWYIKDEQTHSWPATAQTCNSFDTSDCGSSASAVVLE